MHRMLTRVLLVLAVCQAYAQNVTVAVEPGQEHIQVQEFRPVEIPKAEAALLNSGTGWHLGYDWGPGTHSYDIYVRINWRELEPTRDHYDFTKIEDLLQKAEARGGRASLRVRGVATAGIGMPDYMMQLMPKGFMKDWLYNKKPETYAYVPDWNDTNFLERARALLMAIGKKYNPDPRLAFIDVGMYGRWGEWHCAGIQYPAPSGAREITEDNIKAIIDMHLQAFPDKRLVMMTDNLIGLKYALSKSVRMGWRRDSYGTGWFQDPMRMQIVADRWKTAPVIAEPIGDVAPGSLKYFRQMERQAAEFHVATIHGINTFKKGLQYSADEREAVANAGKNSGFRFALVSLAIPEALIPGNTFRVSAVWANQGVTPAYEKWQVVYQIRVPQTGTIVWEGASALDLEKLLPTGAVPFHCNDQMVLPEGCAPAAYDFAVIVKDQETKYRLPLALAIAGRQADGSYKLGTVMCSK